MSILERAIDRRRVLKGFLLAGPTLAIATRTVGLDEEHADAAIPGSPELYERQDFTDIFLQTASPFYYDLLVEIKPDSRVYFEVPRMDIGQGVLTVAAMMLADNLDVPLENVDVALSKGEPKRADGQLTGGSHATRSEWDPIRVVAAQIRARLKTAAADRWGVSPGSLRTEKGFVVAPDGRKLSYGELSADAAKMTAPKDVPQLKKPEEYKIIGTPVTRSNALDIATGKAQYCMDLPVEGALPTVFISPATQGATFVSMDDSEAMKIPGVIAVTPIPGYPEQYIPGGVAITAETFGIAKRAKDALKVQWSKGTMDTLSDTGIDDILKQIQDQVVTPDTGEGMVDAVFRWPYVNHAPMETNTAIGHVTPDKVEVWSGLQIPTTAIRNIAKVLGYREDQVIIRIQPRGGAFGRYLFHDAAFQVAQIAQKVGKPIKLMWLREDDIKYGRNRPVSLHHVRATIKGGQVASFEHRAAMPELDLHHGLGDIITHQVVTYNNNDAGVYFYGQSGSGHIPYDVGFRSSTLQQHLLAVPTAPWRVVYSGQVCSVNDMVIHELADLLKQDEYEFRRSILESDRHRAVLDKAAHEGEWGRKLPDGVGQGFGFHDEYHSLACYLMEVDTRGKEPRMTRCTIAADVGYAVNPSGVIASLMGQAHDGFGVVFRAGLHVDDGVIRESNWHDYKWTRMYDSAPDMRVFLLPKNLAVPGGVGELGVPAASAAAANAWARATGKKPRNFPLNEYGA